ncbi:MAG: TolC family protein [Bdellovibrionales bacterium]|nr:TolC family protein [Bdellovibrionales bacterium]
MHKVVIFIIFFLSFSLRAETLNLKQISHIYMQENHLLKSLRAEIESAREEEKEAARNLWPALSWDTSVTDQKISESLYGSADFFPKKIYSTALSVQQSIYRGGKIWRAWDIRKEAIVTAQLNYFRQEQDLLHQVLLQAVNLFVAQKIKDVLEESKKIQKQFWDIVQKRRQRGASKDFEVAQAEGDYFSYESKIQQQEAIIQQMRLSLASQLMLKSVNGINVEIEFPSIKDLKDNKEQVRPDVLLAKQQVIMAELEKKLAMGDHYPSLVLQGSLGYQAKEREDLIDEDSKNHTFSLALKIPIFSGLTSLAKSRADEAKITSAKMKLQHLREQADMELKNAEQKIKLSLQVFEANKKWSQQAKEAMSKGLKSYKLGVISSFQMVQLQKGYEGAALSYWNSIYNFYNDKLTWLKANAYPLSQFY